MKKEDVNISAVKLRENGLKGVEVTYAVTETKGTKPFLNEYNSKRSAPIHDTLEETFNWLKGFLLDICGYTDEEAERKILINALEMVAVKYSDKGFIISGKLKVLEGEKVVSLTTPLICEEDEYAQYSEVTKILDAIYIETKEYMVSNKMMSDEQIVIRFNEKNPEFDIEAFKKLPKEEKEALAIKTIEEGGGVAFKGEDIADEDDENAVDLTAEPIKKEKKSPAKKEASTELKPVNLIEDAVNDLIKNTPELQVKPAVAEWPEIMEKTIPEKEVKYEHAIMDKPKIPASGIIEEDDDFIIPSQPQKVLAVSTAKLKAI